MNKIKIISDPLLFNIFYNLYKRQGFPVDKSLINSIIEKITNNQTPDDNSSQLYINTYNLLKACLEAHVSIISHNHMDHLDLKLWEIILEINPNIHILVPVGDKEFLLNTNIGFKEKNITEITWWQAFNLTKKLPNNENITIQIEGVPAKHWSGRALGANFKATNSSQWLGYVISSLSSPSQSKVYFAGDTAYDKEMFKAIKHIHSDIDVAIIPIAPCRPQAVDNSHMHGGDAVSAAKIIDAQHILTMHHSTLGMGSNSSIEPTQEWNKAIANNPLRDGVIVYGLPDLK